MTARTAELGSLIWPLALLALMGAGIILRGIIFARYVARTGSPAYVATAMRLVHFRLAPLNVDGSEIATDRLTAKASMVIVEYSYNVNGKAYVSHAVFPSRNEWIQPRISAHRLMDDLESGRLLSCYVDTQKPSESLLFTGWSRFLRSHALGALASGALVILLAAGFYWFV